MTPEETAAIIRKNDLPKGISWYEIQGKVLYEFRDRGGRTQKQRIAYMYSRKPKCRYTLEFPDDATAEQVQEIINSGLENFRFILAEHP